MRILPFTLCLLLMLTRAVAPEVEAEGEAPEPSDTEIVCYSAILSPYNVTITTYSSTELGTSLTPYYDAQVQANLYQGESMVGAGSTPVLEGNPTAEGQLTATATGAQFYLQSNHTIVPAPDMLDQEFGTYYDVYGLATAASVCDYQNVCVVAGLDPPPGFLGPEIVGGIGLGSTWDIVYASPPQITTIGTVGGSPITLGGSGTLIIDGHYLTAGGGDPNPEITVPSGTGLSLTAGSMVVESDNELRVDYTVDSSGSSAGSHEVTVTTDAGTSDEYEVDVGDPTPAISSIATNAPNQADFVAGTTTGFTITGQHFGTSPQVTISGTACTGGSYCGITGTASDTSVAGWITLDAGASGSATVTVTSQGYGSGSNFFHSDGNSATSNSENVAIDPAPALPAPTIVWGQGAAACSGANIAGTTQNVVVGQLITFTGCVPASAQVQSATWSPASPMGVAVGGYGASTQSAVVQPVSATACGADQHCTFNTFYWVGQGSQRNFTFQYTSKNGSSSPAIATFNVDGPSGFTVTPTPSSVNVLNPPNNSKGYQNDVLLILGGTGASGMNFSASASYLPAGAYQWVQLISSDQSQWIGSNGQYTQPDNISGNPEVDVAYPYGYDDSGDALGTVSTASEPNDTAVDSPFSVLPPIYGEFARSFAATMYLMWVPSADSRCTSGADCTIPVPLGYVTWGYHGDAINTLTQLVNGGVSFPQWLKSCGALYKSDFQSNSSFPLWNKPIDSM